MFEFALDPPRSTLEVLCIDLCTNTGPKGRHEARAVVGRHRETPLGPVTGRNERELGDAGIKRERGRGRGQGGGGFSNVGPGRTSLLAESTLRIAISSVNDAE